MSTKATRTQVQRVSGNIWTSHDRKFPFAASSRCISLRFRHDAWHQLALSRYLMSPTARLKPFPLNVYYYVFTRTLSRNKATKPFRYIVTSLSILFLFYRAATKPFLSKCIPAVANAGSCQFLPLERATQRFTDPIDWASICI